MKRIGFSTGAIAFGDFGRALSLLSRFEVNAVELSALRFAELDPLLRAIDHLDLRQFQYVSFHAPSKFSAEDEPRLVQLLRRISDRKWPIILHPDSIFRPELWLPLQDALCFENMDKRKPVGRTAAELQSLFDLYSKASLCFDMGHAHQVDRTMSEGRLIAQRYSRRIRQLHISEVNTRSEHVPISAASEFAFSKVIDLLNQDTPIIIESVVREDEIESELIRVVGVFEGAIRELCSKDWG